MLSTTPFLFFLAVALAIDTPCNPAKEWSCIARNKALSAAVYDSMTVEPNHFESNMGPPNVEFGQNGAMMKILERGQNPQLASTKYIMYGRAEAEVKASHGKSVISSMYMQSDDLDEIDIGEFFGGHADQFQTNYFVKGNISNYERDRYHKAHGDVTATYHKYAVEWTPESIIWQYDGRMIRKVLSHGNTHGFPSSPMRLMFSLWVGGDPDNHPGTIEWAGGEADYHDLPYTMGVRNVRLVDYSSGQQYVYGRGKKVGAVSGEIFGRTKRESGEDEDFSEGLDEEGFQKEKESTPRLEPTDRTEFDIDYDDRMESKGSKAFTRVLAFALLCVGIAVLRI